MKNILTRLGLFILSLWPAIPSLAATSATTAAFLVKLNGYYYCLAQEGLKNYHCDVTLSPLSTRAGSALRRAARGLRFTVDDSVTDATSVQGSAAPATGNASVDPRVAKLQQTLLDALKTFLQSWKSFAMEPLNDPADMEKSDLKFKRLDDGFQVLQTDPLGGTLTGTFDKKGKMLELLIQEGGPKTLIQPEFMNTQKGYLLTGLRFKAGGVDQSFKVKYGVADRYWLPQDLTARVKLENAGAKNADLHFHFSGYRVNQ